VRGRRCPLGTQSAPRSARASFLPTSPDALSFSFSEHRPDALEAARIETERIEAERIEAERIESERIKAARVETEHIEAERKAERKQRVMTVSGAFGGAQGATSAASASFLRTSARAHRIHLPARAQAEAQADA
jgi:hypothetical protein